MAQFRRAGEAPPRTTDPCRRGGGRAWIPIRRRWRWVWLVTVLLAGWVAPAGAQIVEATGSRALGMGGAFVAVANDASATWWNPGGLADGPFLDMSLSRAVTASRAQIPARQDRIASFAIGTPPFGFSYYRLRLTEIRGSGPTAGEVQDRQEHEGRVAVRSLAASQIGVTLLQTLVSGVHAGTTLKYVRATYHADATTPAGPVPDLLEYGDDLSGGETGRAFDLDVGILATAGAMKVGAVVRNVRAPVFEHTDGARMQLPRQVRVGVAYDGSRVRVLPLTASFDADLRRYETATGERRVVAIGVEHWLFRRRIAVRAGGRFNTVGPEDRAATGGLSIKLPSATYLDGHVVRGGSAEDRGWGLAARVSF